MGYKKLSCSLNAFFAVSYIPFILPVLCASFFHRSPDLWFFSCISISVASLAATIIAKKPIIAGPSIGSISVILANIIPNLENINQISIIILITSCILLVTSLTSAASSFVNTLSNDIKTGFKSGLGLMFLLISYSMVASNTQSIGFFLILLGIFYYAKDIKFVNPAICIVVTLLANNFYIPYSFNPEMNLHIPELSFSIIPNAILLAFTMFIDCSITGNTLNPGNEHRSLQLAGANSFLSSFAVNIPISIYLESLIYEKNSHMISGYIFCILYALVAFLSSKIIIPSYLSAALLGMLGIKIFVSTKPQSWYKNSTVPLLVMAIIALYKSFLYGICAGMIYEVLQAKYRGHIIYKKNYIWLTILSITSSIILFI